MVPQTRKRQPQQPFVIYLLALFFSVIWLVAAATGNQNWRATLPHSLLVALGGFLPALACLGVISFSHNRTALKSAQPASKTLGWLLISMAYPVSITLLIVLDLLQITPAFILTWVSQPFFLVLNLTAVLLIGPLADLIGYKTTITRLLTKNFPHKSGKFILWLVWWLWHLPFIFLNGTALSRLHFSPLLLILYLTTVLGLSFFFTWGYDIKHRQVLITAFRHF